MEDYRLERAQYLASIKATMAVVEDLIKRFDPIEPTERPAWTVGMPGLHDELLARLHNAESLA